MISNRLPIGRKSDYLYSDKVGPTCILYSVKILRGVKNFINRDPTVLFYSNPALPAPGVLLPGSVRRRHHHFPVQDGQTEHDGVLHVPREGLRLDVPRQDA